MDEWIEVLHPFVMFLLELLRRFDTGFLTEMTALLPLLVKMRDVVEASPQSASRKQRQFARDFGELSR